MSLLTDDEINALSQSSEDTLTVIRETERAVIAKLAAGGGVEPVAYLAWLDGKPAWDREDCVCEDDVYPTEVDDRCTSMPLYTHPAPDHTALLRQAMEALKEMYGNSLGFNSEGNYDMVMAKDAITAIEGALK